MRPHLAEKGQSLAAWLNNAIDKELKGFMNIVVTWITGQTTLEIVNAARLELLKASKRVLRLERFQGGNIIILKGELEENGENERD